MHIFKSVLALSAAVTLANAAQASVEISHDFDSAGIGTYSVTGGSIFGAATGDAASFPDGNALYMNGTSRSVTFSPVNLSAGGTINFDFVIGDYNTSLGYFEGADGGSEDVSFAYSTNNGLSWTNFDVMSPTSSNSGTVSVGGWTSFSYNVAGGAAFSSTKLRFKQSANSGSSYDHWAVDNLLVSANAVPEPASWAMMIGGLALVGGTMRRRTTTLQFA